MVIGQLYRDLHGVEFMKVAQNKDDEIFIAPLVRSELIDGSLELSLDYTNIRVFNLDNAGYTITHKHYNTHTEVISYEIK